MGEILTNNGVELTPELEERVAKVSGLVRDIITGDLIDSDVRTSIEAGDVYSVCGPLSTYLQALMAESLGELGEESSVQEYRFRTVQAYDPTAKNPSTKLGSHMYLVDTVGANADKDGLYTGPDTIVIDATIAQFIEGETGVFVGTRAQLEDLFIRKGRSDRGRSGSVGFLAKWGSRSRPTGGSLRNARGQINSAFIDGDLSLYLFGLAEGCDSPLRYIKG